MSEQLRELDVVALTVDQPEHGLLRGQVGTVVMELASDAVEVEFGDEHGKTYALLPLPCSDLVRLRYTVEAA